MSIRAFANFPLIVCPVIFVGYFLFSPSRTAFAGSFIPIVWLPFIAMLAVHKFIDRHQWAALRVGRMLLLKRYGSIDPATAQAIQEVLIPHRVAWLMPLYLLLLVLSFTLLLFYQGWATTVLAFLGVLVVSFIVSGVSVAIPSAGARADRRCLRAIQSCLERRLLVQPGDTIIPDITRLELHSEVAASLENPDTLSSQYLSCLRKATHSHEST